MRIAWAVLLLATPASTNSAPEDSSASQVLTASANLAFVSPEGCIQNEVSIFVRQTTAKPGAAKTAGPKSDVTYSRSRFDLCEDDDLGTDLGSSSTAVISGDLNRVRVDASIDGINRALRRGFDASEPPIRVAFSLTWTGTGDILRVGRNPGAANARAAVRPDSRSRSATLQGRVDGQDVPAGSIGSILLTTRQAVAH